MVIITFITTLNEKVGYHFGDPILLATTKSDSIYEIQNLEVIMNIFIRISCSTQKNGKRPKQSS